MTKDMSEEKEMVRTCFCGESGCDGNMKLKKKKSFTAWLVTGIYENERGYAYLHFGKKKPMTDTDYKIKKVRVEEL